MSLTTVSFPGYINIRVTGGGFRSQTNSKETTAATKPFILKLKASLQEQSYPLASRIIVKNLSYSTEETSLQKEFSNFGKIAEVKVVKDVTTKRPKGCAFIQFTCQDDAMLALENMDQKVLDGRMIYVEIAKPGRDDFGARLRTSGPPIKWNLPEPKEVVDYWY